MEKKEFIDLYFAENRNQQISLSYLSNIVYDIEKGQIPYYKDILCFIDTLNMSDSLKVVKYYLKILEYGIESVETLKLRFFVKNLIKKQTKNPKYDLFGFVVYKYNPLK